MSRHAVLVRHAHTLGYRVDEDGRVASPRGRLRALHCNPKGYAQFSVRGPNGKHGHVATHKLAAFQKFGEPALAQGVCVRHMDGDPGNNRPSNLELGTNQQNMLDRDPADRQRHGAHAASFRRKLTAEQVLELRARRAAGETNKSLAAEFGLSIGAASDIIRGKQYRDVGPSSAEVSL